MGPSDARLCLFHTSLHYICYIDTAADLRSRSKTDSICIKALCYNMLSIGGGTGQGYT